MTIDFKGGRLPNDPAKPRLKLNNYLTKVASRDSVDYFSEVSDWPMYLNDRIGDCTCAAAGHIIEEVTQYGQGKVVVLPDNDILSAYEAVSGYNPNTGANDNGAVMQDVLNYWRKNGFGGHKILAFAEVDHKNMDEVYAATDLFGFVYLGIDFPAFAMDQFNAGEAWDVSDTNAQIEGGHAINAGWYDKSSQTWKVITWGKVQTMTNAFFDKYVEEAWIAITPEWVEGNDSPEGVDIQALGEAYTQITGKPSPFTNVTPPAPTPTPTPEPAPVPDPNEDDLKSLIKKLIGVIEVLIAVLLGKRPRNKDSWKA